MTILSRNAFCIFCFFSFPQVLSVWNTVEIRIRTAREIQNGRNDWLIFCEQISMKSEMEVAMKLLEKDIHEKQDTIISLRRQLDEIKLINLEMYKKLQVINCIPFHALIAT